MERKGAAKVINSNTSINDIKKIINQILNSKIIQSKMIIALKKFQIKCSNENCK